MEHYTKGEEISVECILPFPKELIEGVTEMIVKEGSKFKNILGFVEKKFEDPKCRRIIFKGVGEATAKCISCVEVFKRSHKNEVLYQWNAVTFSRRSDVWLPDSSKEGLSKLLVHVDVPTMFILLSRDPFPSEYNNHSCQTSIEETTGFSTNERNFGETSSRSRSGKPQLKKPLELNKWRRPRRKSGANAESRFSTGTKPSL